MAKRAKELGQSAIAITDHGEVNQHLAFQKACLAEGVKPLLGMEGYWAPNVQAIRDFCKGENSGKWGSMMSHLCLIAKSNEGLRNLWALSSKCYEPKNFYYRPIAEPAILREYATDLYASDGCMLTAFGNAVKIGDEDAARQYLGGLQSIFGERFYVELHTWQYMQPDPDTWVKFDGQLITTVTANQQMTDLNQAKIRLATEMGIPMVIVNDAHHAYPEHWDLKEMVWGFKKESNPDQQEGKGQKADHIMGDEELYYWMAKHGVSREIVAQAIANSAYIAEQCNTEIKPMLSMPTFTQSDADDFEMFLKKIETGFKDKVEKAGLPRETYWNRMETEVALIADKRFSGYFLIVEDYVRAARTGSWAQYVQPEVIAEATRYARTKIKPGDKVPMLIGPGRGSAGGSLVAYLLGITNIDPIKYGLLFERFLIPERKGLPDIDIDFPRSKRPGMKHYMEQRWGHEHVCSICTMSRNQARGTVKDIGRALGIDHVELEKIGALVEKASLSDFEEEESAEDHELTWEEIADRHFQALGPAIQKYPELFDKVNKMTGTIRQTGVHAAALLLSKEELSDVLPTRVKNGIVTTQFDMYDVEELGGLKGDFLALRHLDTLEIAAELITERHGVELDYESFDETQYCDPEIWAQIDDGQTVGIFQLGTPGGTDSAIEFRPRSHIEVADLISINRPGVRDAGLYNAYLRRRAGIEEVTYAHPMMQTITGSTFGILVYQEQLIQTARELAGFTAGEADGLRKATAKKLPEKVATFKEKFIAGCLANPNFMAPWGDHPGAVGEAHRVIETLWLSIQASGRYSFNKSHAVGYALIATQEIWVKHYYAAEFLVACMMVDEAKRNQFIRDARRRGIGILPPDVNESARNFTLTGNNIRYGLEAVRGVGEAAAEALVAGQPYTSIQDYLARAKRGAYKGAAVNLICIGALDTFGDRYESLRALERRAILNDVAPRKRAALTDEEADAIVAEKLVKYPDKYVLNKPNFNDDEVVFGIEQELVGSFVTIDPMGKYLQAIDAEAVKSPAQLRRYTQGAHVIIGGQIVKVKEHTVKKGRTAGSKMCFIGVEWQGDEYDIVCFPAVFERYKYLLVEGAPVLCGCEKTDRGVSLLKLFRLDLVWGEEAG